MEKDPGALLYQPNLTCTYIPTKTPDDRIRVLVVQNKDPIGINDAQIATSLWSYVQNFRERLKKQEDAPKEIMIPECIGSLTLNEKHDAYTIVMISQAEDITLCNYVYLHLLTQLTMSMAQQLNVELEGVNATRSEGGATPSGEARI